VCACVCACARARERAQERKKDIHTQNTSEKNGVQSRGLVAIDARTHACAHLCHHQARLLRRYPRRSIHICVDIQRICTYTCMRWICVRVYVYTQYICTYLYIDMCTYLYTHIYICKYAIDMCICIRGYAHIYICMYAIHMYMYMWVCHTPDRKTWICTLRTISTLIVYVNRYVHTYVGMPYTRLENMYMYITYD